MTNSQTRAAVFALLLAALGCSARMPDRPLGAPKIRVEQVSVPVQRDSNGRVVESGSSVMRQVQAATDSVHARIRLLRVIPDKVIASVGDTLTPEFAVRISGFDSSGAEVRRVVPLYGRFTPEGIVKRLDDGRWLMIGVGEAVTTIRPMRFNERPSRDTALVRTVRVLVLR